MITFQNETEEKFTSKYNLARTRLGLRFHANSNPDDSAAKRTLIYPWRKEKTNNTKVTHKETHMGRQHF